MQQRLVETRLVLRMLYRWNGSGLPFAPGTPKTSRVLYFGVAVNAKKLRLGCRPRLAIVSRGFLRGRASPCSSASCLAFSRMWLAASTPLSSLAASPDCELWASSTMTAYLRSGRSPTLSVTNGNFCKVVMMIGTPVFRAVGQLAGVLVDLLDHALLVLELVDGVLQLAVEDARGR